MTIRTSVLVVHLTLLCLPALAQDEKPKDESPAPAVKSSRKAARRLPLPKQEDVWHFAIYGDRTGGPRSGLEVLRQAVSDTNLLDPDLVMTVGDLIQGYNTEKPWMRQMKEFQGIMKGLEMPWFPVAGNHDIYWRGPGRPAGHHEQNYETHFGPLWYWFPHKNAAFIVLYSDEGDPKSNRKGWNREQLNQFSARQLDWLKETLVETKGFDHVFVFMHHPRWISRVYTGTNWQRVHEALVAAGNVTACFAGHIHRMVYSGKRDGIEYFALATTGGHLSYQLPQIGYLHHMNLVTVRKDGIATATLPVGTVIDPRSMTPDKLEDVSLLLNSPAPKAVQPLQISMEKRASEYRCTLANPTRRSIEVVLRSEAGKTPWRLSPALQRFVIESGQSVEARVQARLTARNTLGPYGVPQLVIQTDYLGARARISLPERRWAMEARAERLPIDAFVSDAEGALVLDGKGSCLRVPSSALALPDGPMTLEAWINAPSFRPRQPFICKTESSEYGLSLDEGVPAFLVHLDGRSVTVRAKEALKKKRWHHIAGVFDGAELRLYVNGEKVASRAASGERRRNNKPLYIGADPGSRGEPRDVLRGQVDEVRLSKCARYSGERFDLEPRHRSDGDTLLLLHCDRAIGPLLLDVSRSRAHAQTVRRARCKVRKD